MSTTLPAFKQADIATSQFNYSILLNDLNSNDRSFLKRLIRKYGAENYGMWQLLMGQTATYDMTENKQFYHYEKRQLHSSVSVKTTVTGTGAGNTITCVLDTDSYNADGTAPARVWEEVEVGSTGLVCQISAVPVKTANAWQITLKPLNTTDSIHSINSANLLANETLNFRGRMDAGEGSDRGDGLAPQYDKIYNTTTEHRDDFTSSDFALIEKQEVELVDGVQYYWPLALEDMNKRFMNNMFFKILEANGANNLGNGTYGTTGVQARVSAGGSTIEYSAGNPQLSDFQTMGRALNFFGSPGEYHMLQDFYTKQSNTNMLFTTFKNTFNAVSWKSVGGSAEAGAAYGFDSFRDSNISYHMTVNPMYNIEMVYKRIPAATLGDFYRFYSLLIPQKVNQDPKSGESMPSFQIVFQKNPVDGNRIYTWEWGGAANQNKNGKLEKTCSESSYFGVRTIAPNQFAIFRGV